MTARLPKEAMSQALRLRYYQKEHTCYCCNAYALDDIEVIQGGMNVAIVADKAFELYADGKFVGDGEWWEPAKDTYRFKVESHVKTFAVKLVSAFYSFFICHCLWKNFFWDSIT